MSYRKTVVSTTTSTVRGSRTTPATYHHYTTSRIQLHSTYTAPSRIPVSRPVTIVPRHNARPASAMPATGVVVVKKSSDIKRMAKLLKEEGSKNGIKCPVCSKFVLPDDIECHLVMCLTKPRLSYNEDVLGENKGECVICLEDLLQGDTIARLPCLCIYHKGCIDRWFEVNRSCPEHPGD